MRSAKLLLPAWLLWLVVAFLPVTATAQTIPDQSDKLVFGMLPSRSTIAMFNRFAPLRDYLAKKLNKTIVFETAPDYDIFLHRSKQRKYDLILTAPHFALMTLDSGHYEVSVTYRDPLSAIILVHKESNIHHLSDLGGKKISIPPEQAIITIAGKYHLMGSGLTDKKSPIYIKTKSHSTSLHTMLSGETDAAIISNNVARHAIKKGQSVRILANSPNIPGMAILAANDLDSKLRQQFRHLLLNMHKNEEGKKVLKKINYPGYRQANKQDFEPVRPLLKHYRK